MYTILRWRDNGLDVEIIDSCEDHAGLIRALGVHEGTLMVRHHEWPVSETVTIGRLGRWMLTEARPGDVRGVLADGAVGRLHCLSHGMYALHVGTRCVVLDRWSMLAHLNALGVS